MTDTSKLTTLKLTDEDRRTVEKAKRLIAPKGVKVSLAQTLKAALYFFVESKEAEKSVNKPTTK
jgi:hypothetical protein